MNPQTPEGSTNPLVHAYRYLFGVGYKPNIGGLERVVRGGLGVLSTLGGLAVAVFPVAAASGTNTLIAVLLLIGGLYLIYEAVVQYCPLNHTVGRSTYQGNRHA